MSGPLAGGRRHGGLMWHRNFRLLWFGETVNQLGSAMALAGVPLLAVISLRASPFVVGALAAIAWLPWLLIGLPAGAWVDRLPARPLMIICDLVSAVLYASVPLAYWLHELTIGQLGVVELLAGGAAVFFSTAYQVNLPALVSQAELVEGSAKLQGSSSAASLGGRGLAGVTAQALGAQRPGCWSTRSASWYRPGACWPSAPASPARSPAASRPGSAAISPRASGSSSPIPTCGSSACSAGWPTSLSTATRP